MLGATEGAQGSQGRLDPGRRVVLLSLFDGMGTARLALDDTLRALRCGDSLAGSFFAEIDVPLGDAAQ
eukprot:9964870-Lingulodinium_polyedra.AAC.1